MRPWIAALFASIVLAAGSAPAEESLRSGVEAFGDWRSDAPGVRRLITPADMPKPYATASASRGPRLLARPPGMVPRAPENFVVDLVAQGLETPRVVRVAPNGDAFVAESGGGRIRVLRFDADGKAQSSVFASGLNAPYGLAFYPAADPHWLYVGETGAVLRYPFTPGDLSPSGPPQTIVPSLPTGGHWTRDLAFSADGATLFVAVGSQSNVAEGGKSLVGALARALGALSNDETDRADVLAFSPEGERRRVYASGLRNCSGLTLQPQTGALWCVVNERDGLGDDLVPDYATRVREGAFYGWPWYYIGAHQDPRHKGERPDLAAKVTVPDVLLQPHSAPLGITFYEGASFPAQYRGDAFVAMHGSWNRSQRTGYKVVRLRMKEGVPTGEYDDFLTGFVADADSVWGRPVDVAVTADGALLVSDDEGGAIWRVRFR